MTRKLGLKDFRAVRRVLEPHDFALHGDEAELPPSDLIDEEAWHGIMTLPGDVAIRTTSHQGSRIALLHDTLSAWIEISSEYDMVVAAMMDVADSFQAATFNLVHGFYKEAIAALRNAIETMTLAASCKLAGNKKKWKDWEAGEEIRFKELCDQLPNLAPFQTLEVGARHAAATSLFAGNDGSGKNAWARNLYKRLSHFSHARGDSSNFHLWQCNGPVYSPDGLRISYYLFLETHAICLFLAKASQPKLALSSAARLLMKSDSIKQYADAAFQKVARFYFVELFPGTRRKQQNR